MPPFLEGAFVALRSDEDVFKEENVNEREQIKGERPGTAGLVGTVRDHTCTPEFGILYRAY